MRIRDEHVDIPRLQLRAVQSRCDELLTEANEVRGTLESKQKLITELTTKIDRVKLEILNREEHISSLRRTLDDLRAKLHTTEQSLHASERAKKELEYKLMVGAHDDASQTLLNWPSPHLVLLVLFAIGAILAVMMILKKTGRL